MLRSRQVSFRNLKLENTCRYLLHVQHCVTQKVFNAHDNQPVILGSVAKYWIGLPFVYPKTPRHTSKNLLSVLAMSVRLPAAQHVHTQTLCCPIKFANSYTCTSMYVYIKTTEVPDADVVNTLGDAAVQCPCLQLELLMYLPDATRMVDVRHYRFAASASPAPETSSSSGTCAPTRLSSTSCMKSLSV